MKHFGFYDGTTFGIPGPNTNAAYARYCGTPAVVLAAPAAPPTLPTYPLSVQNELNDPGPVQVGNQGRASRRVQEWLTFHGFRTPIDDEFGTATERTLQSFQDARGLPATGALDPATWAALIAPMVRAFSDSPKGATFGDTVLDVARQHLDEHPIELGGPNCGPWVRAYMNGNQGTPWAWCAGFVSFVMAQAAKIQGASKPIAGSFSCDLLATQAEQAGLFVAERSLNATPAKFTAGTLGTCCIFLVRRTSSDWTHTGFAFDFKANGTFSTIEGNTNDQGCREGFEVCKRVRARDSKDFIRLK
ncbi:MAG TPA: peptidoglycan-binding domain-containing protein [Lamprocystis sp. (in: g-proteobacteria)]|nr:peptidoglycan-binding domain-containing protein [Lamprocystis sp. (in: g-proteobacteria)]